MARVVASASEAKRQRWRLENKRQYERKKAAGLCQRCGAARVTDGTRCQPCREKRAAGNRAAARVRYRRRRAASLCPHCNSPATCGVLCGPCRERSCGYHEKRRRGQGARPGGYRTLVTVAGDPLAVAWAAGLIDGEGCIRVNKIGGGSAVLAIIVSMTNAAAIRRLQAIFGGAVRGRKARQGCLPQFAWEAFGQNAVLVLRAIAPHLTVKRQQAELGVAFYERVSAAPRVGPKNRTHTTETVRYIERTIARMRALKKDGGR
jgi:hypothetical protein